MNIKKQWALLLLFIPGFIFSMDELRTMDDNRMKAFVLRKTHPNLMEQYDRAQEARNEARQNHRKAVDFRENLLGGGKYNLMSRPQALRHFLIGDLPLKDVISGDLSIDTFERNCYESAENIKRYEDLYNCETKECKLYSEMFKRYDALLGEALDNMNEMKNKADEKKQECLDLKHHIQREYNEFIKNKN